MSGAALRISISCHTVAGVYWTSAQQPVYRGSPLGGCPRLLVRHIDIFFVSGDSCIHALRVRGTLMTGNRRNISFVLTDWGIEVQSSDTVLVHEERRICDMGLDWRTVGSDAQFIKRNSPLHTGHYLPCGPVVRKCSAKCYIIRKMY